MSKATTQKTRVIAEPGILQVEIIREFDAPRDLVFRAYTDPQLLVRWMGPRRLSMVVDRQELRDGGTWRFIHRDDEGNEYGFHGVIHGTPSPDGFVRTSEFEGAPGHVSLETATFEERDGRTLVRATSVFQSVIARDMAVQSGMEQGVNEGMERLDDLLARLTATS